MWTDGFDLPLMRGLNAFALNVPVLDPVLATIDSLHLTRGVVIVLLLWLCFTDSRMETSRRLVLLWKTATGTVLAIVLARGLQNFLPGQVRPRYNPALDFRQIGPVEDGFLRDWSSFPSDHAVLFFALSTAIFLMDRRLGMLAYAWSALVICFTRVYLGHHYPSDILAGAVLGVAVMLAVFRLPTGGLVRRALLRLDSLHPGAFTAALFVFGFMCATLFGDVRNLARGLSTIVGESF